MFVRLEQFPVGLRTTTVVGSASTRMKPLPTSWDLARSLRLSANLRYHRVRSLIAQPLREKHLTVHEEVSDIADKGTTRRIDIIAFTPDASTAINLDPTVLLETRTHQSIEVNLEKRNIYLPTITYYEKKYKLMIGARGTIPAFFRKFCLEYNLGTSFIQSVTHAAMKGSVQILRNHLYG